MRRIPYLAIAGAIVAIAAAARAGGYNDAGCGIGAMLFPNNKKGSQILAATTNQFLGNTYSITTGTSGCSQTATARRRLEREKFVATNFRDLSRELAAGQGEYAASFATLMGCKAESVPAFLQFAKERYVELFPQAGTTPQRLLEDVSSQAAADPAIAKACTL